MLTHPDTVFIDEGVDFLDTQLYAASGMPLGLATILPRRAYMSEVFQRTGKRKDLDARLGVYRDIARDR